MIYEQFLLFYRFPEELQIIQMKAKKQKSTVT